MNAPAKESHADAHARIINEGAEPSDDREKILLGNVQPPEEPPETPPETPAADPAKPDGEPDGEPGLVIPDGKEESLANLRKKIEQEQQARLAAEAQAKSFEEERKQYEARLASYDYRQTREFRTKFVEPLQQNISTVQTLWKTYTGKEIEAADASKLLHADYQTLKNTLGKAKIDRTDKILEVWEASQIIEEDARKALESAPERLSAAKQAEAEEDEARKRISAQRLHKEQEEVKSSLRTDVIGYIEVADNPEYNAKVAGRLAKYEHAAKDPASRDALVLIGKGVVYDELVSEILTLKERLKKHENGSHEREDASRISSGGVRRKPKEKEGESHREAHQRILGR